MQERKVTVGGQDHKLPDPFFVLATQNPVEQEGTYPLPEAQLDRFLMHVKVEYPKAAAEAAILQLARTRAREALVAQPLPVRLLSQAQVFEARREVLDLHLAPQLEQYLVQLVLATREPGAHGAELSRFIAYGASPRGTIALDRCARAHAWLAGRDYVTPEDVHAIAPDVLRHRVLLTYEAEAEGIDADRIVNLLLERVPLP
jgi:MoxR-like ATPase